MACKRGWRWRTRVDQDSLRGEKQGTVMDEQDGKAYDMRSAKICPLVSFVEPT